MDDSVINLVILGSTGSVGTQTLDVVRTFPARFRVIGLAANRSIDMLEKQVKEFKPEYFCCNVSDDEKSRIRATGCMDVGIEEIVRFPKVDMVVTATVGDVALKPTFAAIKAGKTIALANKETVVMAGELVTKAARENSVRLLPLDSEPSAIWQCLQGESKSIEKLIITASGGAFRGTPLEELHSVTAEQALHHPTWTMGPKITVDSATMMNKAFEVIEAKWLFGLPWEHIDVVIHPQSMIHSMVEFADGSVKAQISPPDMRLPIQYALLHPDRVYNESMRRFDPVATGALTFEPWDSARYPCFDLALEVAKKGGTWPAALSGADDFAVDAFLNGHIRFTEIESVIRQALSAHQNIESPDLDQIIDAARWARDSVKRIVEER